MLRKKEQPLQTQCLNCETRFCGWFCPDCGQKAQTRRLTTLEVIKDFLDALSDSDRGFLKTAIDLFHRPGAMLLDYLAGQRKRYLSAGKYTLLFVVLFTLNISFLEKHFGFFESLTGMVETLSVTQVGNTIHLSDQETQQSLVKKNPEARPIKDSDADSFGVINLEDENKVLLKLDFLGQKIDKKASKREFLEFIKYLLPKYHKTLFDTLKIFLVLWIPVFSLFSFFFFREQKLNFAEHITINSYIYSQLLLLTLMLSVFYWVLPTFNGTTLLTTMIVTSFYLFYSYLDVFSKGRRRLIKTIFSVLLGATTYGTLLMSLILIQVLYVAALNIERL